MAVLTKIEENMPLCHITLDDGCYLSTEPALTHAQGFLGKELSTLRHDNFALDWLFIQHQALCQKITPLDFLCSNAAPAAQTTSFIGHLCSATQTMLDKALTDVCLLEIPAESPEHFLQKLRLGRGRFLRLKLIGDWDDKQIFTFLSSLKGLPIESVELPFACYGPAFQAQCLIPLAVRLESHKIDAVLQDKPTHRLHLDPVLLGGVQKTLEIALRAKERFLDPIISAPSLSPVGMRACVALGRAIDLQGHFTHDLDQIKNVKDVAPLHIQAGWLID